MFNENFNTNGQQCVYCNEIIKGKEIRKMINVYQSIHIECLIRIIRGSVAHQQKRCPCFGGNEDDNPMLSKRENAIEAAKYYIQSQYS